MNNTMTSGRSNQEWSQEIWDRINQAIHDETKRAKVAARFLPLYMSMPHAFIVPADVTNTNQQPLTVDETKTTEIVEILVEIALTPQQYQREPDLMTAVTLATRAANLLSQGEDLLINQGEQGLQNDLFRNNKVSKQSGNPGSGLVGSLAPEQIVPVRPTAIVEGKPKWGENTLAAVAEGYSRLQNEGHYGPYALMLHTDPYADTYAPLPTTLITPAEPIKALVTAGFYGTGTLPPNTGILVSLGGDTMDLVMAVDTKIEFDQNDNRGRYLFRVYERFAFRLKVSNAVIKLDFQTTLSTTTVASEKSGTTKK